MEIRIIIIALIIVTLIILLVSAGREVDVNTDKQVDGLSPELQEILHLASLSPSSHNIQGWITKVDTGKEQITIEADKLRGLNVVDPENRELHISLGCYTETLLYAFKAYGYDAVSTYDTEHHQCVVDFSKTTGEKDDYAVELLERHHTDKNPYLPGRKIEESVAGDILKKTMDTRVYLYGSEGFDIIKSASLTAYTRQAYNEAAAEELSKWLRLSDKEAKTAKDGLPAEQLGIRGIKKTLYYCFTDHENAAGGTFAKQGIDTCKKQLEAAAGFAVVCGNDNEADLVKCGRNTVRLWLALTEQGISVHQVSYALEDRETKETIEEGFDLPAEPQMIIRIGYVNDYGKNAKIRRDLSDYVSVVSSAVTIQNPKGYE